MPPLHVLHVEDDPDDVDIVRRVLTRQFPGVEIVPSVSIHAALDVLSTNESFDLALIDLRLPDGNGLDLLAHIRRKHLPMAVVVMTGQGGEETVQTVFKAGADDYIAKRPGFTSEIAPILRSVLESRQRRKSRDMRPINLWCACGRKDEAQQIKNHLAEHAAYIHVELFDDGLSVLRRLPEQAPLLGVDVLIVDESLGGLSALDLIKEIRTHRGLWLPVVFLVGQGNEELAVQAFRLGAVNYLPRQSGYLKQLPLMVDYACTQADLIRQQSALRESEERFRRLAENAPDVIYRILIAPELKIDYVSPSAQSLLGYPVEEMLRDPTIINRVLMPEHRVDHDQIAGKKDLPSSATLHLRARDGRELWAEVRNSLIYNEEGQIAGCEGVLRDVTSQRKTQEQVARQLRRLEMLRNIDQAISSSLDLRLTLIVLTDQIIHQLNVDAADILLFDPHTQSLNLGSAAGFHVPIAESLRIRAGEGYAGRAVLDRRILHFPGPEDYDPGQTTRFFIEREGFKSGMFAPLICKGEIKGVLELFWRSAHQVDDDWVGFLEILTGQAAVAIDHSELFERLQRTNQELSLAYDAMLEGWVRSMDARLNETDGHTQRVTRMTVDLAEDLWVPPEQIIHIRRGAMLHDIGKSLLPDALLLKDGPLTAAEWEQIHRHPRLGYELLISIPFLEKALDIPYAHHEKWDGSGYPRGLAGRSIPLGARLFAVADVWDSLRMSRPYRPPWPRDEALQYIRSQSGVQFDPDVVQAFLKRVEAV